MQIADSKIIPAKAGAGEADLQARYIRFDNYTFLKQAAKRNDYKVDLWKVGSGAHLALFPNMNTNGPGLAEAVPRCPPAPRAVARHRPRTRSTR